MAAWEMPTPMNARRRSTTKKPSEPQTLEELVARFPGSMAAVHAELTLALPRMREFKVFERGDDGSRSIKGTAADPRAIDTAKAILVDRVDRSVGTLGHLRFAKLAVNVADVLRGHGDDRGADAMLDHMSTTLSKRGAKVPGFVARRAKGGSGS